MSRRFIGRTFRTRMIRGVVVGISLVLIGLALAVWLRGGSGETQRDIASPEAVPDQLQEWHEGWNSLSAGPVESRAGMAVARIDHRVAYWGGFTDSPSPTFHEDGAILDVRSGRWSEIPPSPMGPRSAADAVWTGTEVVVWGGVGPAGESGAERRLVDGGAYEPGRGWRAIPEAPVEPRRSHHFAWTGEELLVWGGHEREGPAFADGAAYDPKTDAWRTISPAPLVPTFDGYSSVWTGQRFLVVGTEGAAAYDPATDLWEALPRPDDMVEALYGTVWTGEEAVFWPVGRDVPALSFDPGDRSWRSIEPVLPAGDRGFVEWTGEEIVVVGREDRSSAMRSDVRFHVEAFDPSSDGSRTLEAPDAQFDSRAPAVWSGGKLVLIARVKAADPEQRLLVHVPPTQGTQDQAP